MADLLAPAPPVPASHRRRALGVCLLLAATLLVGGIDLPARGYEAFRYATFGFTGGLLGILYTFALASRGVLWRPGGWLGTIVLVYWAAATGMMFRLLLPPPGLVQVGLAVLAAVGAAIIVSRRQRESAVLALGIVTVTLAVIRFALVPAFWARSDLPNWGPLRFGASADALRDFFVAYTPERPVSQALHFLALCLWVAALWLQWEPPEPAGVTQPRGRSEPSGPDPA
ncbi:MAG TPA: hypothetical protein VMR66_05305 [Gemmatimonadota bacterium]|nr:hypothetical protein [Gemmatimonadota bacterium]